MRDVSGEVPVVLDDELPAAVRVLAVGDAQDVLARVGEDDPVLVVQGEVGAARGVLEDLAEVEPGDRLDGGGALRQLVLGQGVERARVEQLEQEAGERPADRDQPAGRVEGRGRALAADRGDLLAGHLRAPAERSGVRVGAAPAPGPATRRRERLRTPGPGGGRGPWGCRRPGRGRALCGTAGASGSSVTDGGRAAARCQEEVREVSMETRRVSRARHAAANCPGRGGFLSAAGASGGSGCPSWPGGSPRRWNVRVPRSRCGRRPR
ncbi:hypothetical protein DER30_0322 [Streptomyces sp. HB202]|nr:hypothetical protein DER30_0322 [Streptomyces sp. HB202]